MTNSGTRVRFAPSPTGFLHVGGARTALFNWLFARKTGGEFFLRVEDTDRQRSTDEHTQVILDGMGWLGMDWDGDLVFQGANLERHQQWADRVMDTGHAYMNDGAVWFRMPDETLAWEDDVYEAMSFEGKDIKDWVILRSDRTPTYNFSVVADDIDMGITHVIRGSDHLSNTPKQLAVYRALGVDPPAFGHVPMIDGPDGKKLSKRHGATAVGDYRELGFLPAAMRNFLCLLGWSPGNDRELYFEMDELVEAFSLDGIQKKSAVFDLTKLTWMNGQYLSRTPPAELIPLIQAELAEKYGIDAAARAADVERAVLTVRARARTTLNVAYQVAVRLDPAFIERDEKAEKMLQKDLDGFRLALEKAAEHLDATPDSDWNADALDASLRTLAEGLELGLGKVMQPIRVAITGGTVSEAVNELLVVVGKDQSLQRMRDALAWEPTATQ
jgi:glutamyl-tRNA synthetase